MKTTSRFRPYNPDQLFLLPQDMKQWLPEEDLVYFIMDVARQLDLRQIYRPYELERRGQPPYNPTMSEQLDSKRQRNFTDPDSRIMPASGSKDFIQGYNCQAAVDWKALIIVVADVTQETNNKQQVEPLVMLDAIMGAAIKIIKSSQARRLITT